MGYETSTKNEITCALTAPNPAENVELWGQCPVDHGDNPMMLEKLTIEHYNSIMKVTLLAIFVIALCCVILWKNRKGKLKKKEQALTSSKGAGKWMKKLLVLFVLTGIIVSIWLFWYLNEGTRIRRTETLENMCDERARMLQDQFNVSMNHVHALAILVSTFYHGKEPPAIDQVILHLHLGFCHTLSKLRNFLLYRKLLGNILKEHLSRGH